MPTSPRSTLTLKIVCLAAIVTACSGNYEPLPPASLPPEAFSQFTTETMQISLPSSFVQVETKKYLDAVSTYAAAREPATASQLARLSPATGGLELVAIDMPEHESNYATNVNIGVEHTIPLRSLSQIAQSSLLTVPDATDVEQAPFSIGGDDGVRASFHRRIDGQAVAQVQYLIAARGSIWSIVFSTTSNEYEARRSSFDTAALSFRVLRNPSLSEYLRDNSECVTTVVGMALLVLGIVAANHRNRKKQNRNPGSA
jgi:hypothetical protein